MTRTLVCTTLLLAALTACSDDPFLVRWEEDPQEAVLYALDRDELNRPSAFSMFDRQTVVIEDPQVEGAWDFALDRQDGEMVLLPPGVLGIVSRAALVPIPDVEYDEVRRAPADTLQYVTDEAVPVEVGTIYVVRTFQRRGSFGRTCVYYGKVEPLELDLESGVFRFLHDTSADCNNRSLIPPE